MIHEWSLSSQLIQVSADNLPEAQALGIGFAALRNWSGDTKRKMDVLLAWNQVN